jgi:eukaryotic-like serine/threonine-protein kinase
MSFYCVNGGGAGRSEVRLGPCFAHGGEGFIHEMIDAPLAVAKIYKRATAEERARDEERHEKVLAMLDLPPRLTSVSVGTTTIPLLAWPTHVLEEDAAFSGFLMPRISTMTFGRYLNELLNPNQLSTEQRCLPARLTLCRNLAGIVADLHAQKHFVVDFKPTNIYVFPESGIPCFLDNDGFSIAGKNGRRFTAKMVSANYICPELLNEASQTATGTGNYDRVQDEFALAVLLFQILNDGVHPYQGVIRDLNEPHDPTVDGRVSSGWYAYGLSAHPNQAPRPFSNHECIPKPTRTLFDRAFGVNGNVSARPTAAEWRDHFHEYLEVSKPFTRCEVEPESQMHIHFRDYPCAACRNGPLVLDELAVPALDESFPLVMPPASRSRRRILSRVVVILILTVTSYLVWYYFFGLSAAR